MNRPAHTMKFDCRAIGVTYLTDSSGRIIAASCDGAPNPSIRPAPRVTVRRRKDAALQRLEALFA